MKNKEIPMPALLKVIYVIFLIHAIIAFVFAAIFSVTIGILAGLILAAAGIFDYFVYKGLKNRKRWARNVILGIAYIGLAVSLFALFVNPAEIIGAILYILINAMVIRYMAFDKTLKIIFAKKEKTK